MAYLHGAYGEILDSKVNSAQQADAVAVYIGTAPVNLIRDYADKDLVNMPLKIQNMGEVQTKLGYSDNWQDFTLCEVFAEHFDNTVGNVGPIYVVNVLDPAVHRDTEKATKTLTFRTTRAGRGGGLLPELQLRKGGRRRAASQRQHRGKYQLHL